MWKHCWRTFFPYFTGLTGVKPTARRSLLSYFFFFFSSVLSLCQRERKINGCEMRKCTEDAQIFIVY